MIYIKLEYKSCVHICVWNKIILPHSLTCTGMLAYISIWNVHMKKMCNLFSKFCFCYEIFWHIRIRICFQQNLEKFTAKILFWIKCNFRNTTFWCLLHAYSDPKARPELVTSVSLHMASRESPYPNTKFQRFPVFDKYVSWEVGLNTKSLNLNTYIGNCILGWIYTFVFIVQEAYSTYDPVLYTKPIDEYRESVQSLVDADFIE